MSLEYAILGFLNYRPLSGYDLKKIFDTSVRHFWPADQSQIYRTLNRLTERGWAEMEKVEQENRPDRKEYSITDVGRQELQEWLSAPLPFGESRSAPLIQVFFAGQLSDEEVLEMFERVAEHMRAGLAAYDAVPQQIEAYEDYTRSQREFFFWMLTLDIGKHTARANLEWLEGMIERIRSGEIPQN
jgi:PadR family transcriptional regulator, regulatory protein AphA